VSPEQLDAGAGYAERVRAWAADLRAGSTQTWAEFRDGAPVPTTESTAAPLPGAAQLELVRRLAATSGDVPHFGELADLVLTTTGPGRGLVDVPLPWHGPPPMTGTPPVEPDALPPDELVRAATGALVALLASMSPPPPVREARRWPPWRRGFVLLGAPITVGLVRAALLDHGLREGGSRATCFVLGGPLDDLMAQQWAARVRGGAALRWQRLWRAAQANNRVPPAVALPALAARLARRVDLQRVHVVVADDTTKTLAHVAGVLGVPAGPLPEQSEVLATDLLRRLNPALTLAVGAVRRRRLVDRVWPEIAGGEPTTRLGIPGGRFAWAAATGEQMAAELSSGLYAVHGDPGLVVPVHRPGVRRAPDPDAVLAHALTVLGRAWRAGRTEAAGGRT
jgi:hypothetical protein